MNYGSTEASTHTADGLDQGQVDARITAGVKVFARTDGRKISRAQGDLDAATSEEINDAVPHDGVTVSGNDLVFSSNSGASTAVTLPVNTGPKGDKGDPGPAGPQGPAGSGEGGTGIGEFNTGVFINGERITIAVANIAYAFTSTRSPNNKPVNSNVIRPGTRFAYSILEAGEADVRGSFDAQTLIDKAKITRDGAAISSGSAVEIEGNSGSTILIGVDTSGNWYIGSPNDLTTYTISISELVQDIEDFARRSQSARVPVAKLGSGTPDGTKTLHDDGTWKTPSSGGGGTSNELSVLSALPSVTGYSVGDIINVNGELQELAAGTTDRHLYRGTVADRTGNYIGDDFFEWEEDPANIRAHLSKAVLGATPPDRVFIEVTAKTTNGSTLYAETYLDRPAGTGNDRPGDTSTTYQYLRGAGAAGISSTNVVIGDSFSVAFYTTATKTTSINVLTNVNRWVRDDRNEVKVASEAIAGNTDRWPPNKLPTNIPYGIGTLRLPDTSPGLSITRLDADQRAATPYLFNPTFDLDDADKQHGEFHFSLELTLTSGTNTVSFESQIGAANDSQKRRTLSKIIFASDVRGQTSYVTTNSGDPHGVLMFSVPIYEGQTKRGDFRVLVIKHSTNEIGIFRWYDGSGSTTAAAIISATLRTTFSTTDAGVASLPRVTTRGPKMASAFIASGIKALNALIPAPWVVESAGANKGFSAGTNALNCPLNPGDSNDGLWVVTKLATTEKQRVFLPWGPGLVTSGQATSHNQLYSEATIFFRFTGEGGASFITLRYQIYTSGVADIKLYGTAGSIPTGALIEIYEAGVFLS